MDSNINLVVRKGRKEDVSDLLKLIKELAVYERQPEAVIVSEAQLLEDGFGSNPLYGLFVAELDEQVVGISLFYVRYSTWKGKCVYLEDLIVTEKHRRKGVGSALFEATLNFAKLNCYNRLNWQVLDWNTPAIDFYKKYEASFDGEWLNGVVAFEL
ncbi:MAG: GNAT family N-acetyltransferase [Flavobacteriales bacterium]|nr:GNAT family N-acetyltransferase [Flavobacteriales bacterium]